MLRKANLNFCHLILIEPGDNGHHVLSMSSLLMFIMSVLLLSQIDHLEQLVQLQLSLIQQLVAQTK